MTGVSVSFTLGREVVADYRRVEDMEKEFAEPGELPSGDPAEAGWVFGLRAREFASATGRPNHGTKWVTLIEGGSAGGIDVAAAVLVSAIIENIGPDVTQEVEHRIEGSAVKFKEEFGEAFDLTIGAPELLDEE